MEMDRKASLRLNRFYLRGVEETERRLGKGCFSLVVELSYRGLACAGKTFHSQVTAKTEDFLWRLGELCEMLSDLRHPNIVEFLGVYQKFEHEAGAVSPAIVTELLHTTLSQSIESCGVLPTRMSYAILEDVALGLRYLHERSPPLVHGDLSARNVLLTRCMSAKISDVGVAAFLDWNPAYSEILKKVAHLPPEVTVFELDTVGLYTNKVDVFSYGVLIIHVLTGRWPEPDRPSLSNSDYQLQKSLSFTEADSFAEYLHDFGEHHPLMGVTLQCLLSCPGQRPEMSEVLSQVSKVASRSPPVFADSLEMLQKIEEHEGLQASWKLEISRLSLGEDITVAKVTELERLRLTVDKLKAENIALKAASRARVVSPMKVSMQAQSQVSTDGSTNGGMSPVQVRL